MLSLPSIKIYITVLVIKTSINIDSLYPVPKISRTILEHYLSQVCNINVREETQIDIWFHNLEVSLIRLYLNTTYIHIYIYSRALIHIFCFLILKTRIRTTSSLLYLPIVKKLKALHMDRSGKMILAPHASIF